MASMRTARRKLSSRPSTASAARTRLGPPGLEAQALGFLLVQIEQLPALGAGTVEIGSLRSRGHRVPQALALGLVRDADVHLARGLDHLEGFVLRFLFCLLGLRLH